MDELRVTVNVRAGEFVGQGGVVESRSENVEDLDGLSIDELLAHLDQYVFQQAGHPDAWQLEFHYSQFDQGASASAGQVVVELLEPTVKLAAAVLAKVVADEITRWLRERSGKPR
ncbi:MAG: hypothetical protein K8R99_05920 [Actinomycetia bacterium]|nr:hypothetical protein [Actinomycetes bacterium]